MHFFRWLSDWAFTRLFWLCLLGSTAQADVILWDAKISNIPPRQTLAAGESATTEMTLTQAGYAQMLYVRLSTPPEYATTGASSLLSIWLGDTAFGRDNLIYSGTLLPGGYVNQWLSPGKKWITVDALANSRTFVWLPSMTGTGFHTNAAGQTVATAGFASQVRGVVPEPGAVVLLVCCCAAGIFYAWRGKRGR